VIQHCVLENNVGFGAVLGGGQVVGCTIRNNSEGGIAGYDGAVQVDSTSIHDNTGPGVRLRAGTITNSVIAHNQGVGVLAMGPLVVNDNDLENNVDYELYNDSSDEVNARLNYWGPTTTAEMNAGGNPKNIGRIFDSYDNASKGFANYSAWRNSTAVEPTSWGRVKALFR
jgi:hypothetical protein